MKYFREEFMEEYVGGEFILTSNSKGLTIKRNETGDGCGEFFEWDDIKHLFNAPKNISSNSDYAKSKTCANCNLLYQCNDVRKHPEWGCEKHDFV
jgi:hypothetical protein